VQSPFRKKKKGKAAGKGSTERSPNPVKLELGALNETAKRHFAASSKLPQLVAR